jgi:hypothetical protein
MPAGLSTITQRGRMVVPLSAALSLLALLAAPPPSRASTGCFAEGEDSSGYVLVKTTYEGAIFAANDDCTTSTTHQVVGLRMTFKAFMPADWPFEVWADSNDPRFHTPNTDILTVLPARDGMGRFSVTTRSLYDMGLYSYEVQIQVSDGVNPAYWSDRTDILNFWVANSPATISPSVEGVFNVGETLTFNAQASDPDHPDGAGLHYKWTPTGPPGSGRPWVWATGDPQSFPVQDPSQIADWTVALDVADAEGEVVHASVPFTIENRNPTLAVTGARDVDAPGNLHLHAEAHDDDGEAVTRQWEMLQHPPGATPPPIDPTGSEINFPVGIPEIGDWVFRCTARDGHQGSATQTVSVHVSASQPRITIPNRNLKVRPGEVARFETTTTEDAFGEPLSFSWDVIQVPNAAGLGLVSGYSTAAAIDVQTYSTSVGTWIFRLTVTDQLQNTAAESVTLLVDADPVARIAGPERITALAPLELTGADSFDPDSPQTPPDFGHQHLEAPVISEGIRSYRWSVLEGPPDQQGNVPQGTVDEILHLAGTEPRLSVPALRLRAGSWHFALEVQDGATEGNRAVDERWVEAIATVPPVARATPLRSYVLDATGTVPEDIAVDGGDSFDPDNLLQEDYAPGLGITDYRWTLVNAPRGCPSPPVLAGGPDARRATLFAAGTIVPAECLGVYEIDLEVTDDDPEEASSNVQATVIVGNCAGAICIERPTTAFPSFFKTSDRTDVVIAFHVNAALYQEPQFHNGLRVQLKVFGEQAAAPPVFDLSWDVDILAATNGANEIHWPGFDNYGNRLPAGRYGVTLQLVDANGNPTGYAQSEPRSIWIQTLRVAVAAGTDTLLDCDALPSAADSLSVEYQVDGADPIGGGFDELRYRIFDVERPGAPTFEGVLYAPFSGSSFAWNGDLGGRFLEPGHYEIELEIREAGAVLATSSRFPFLAYRLRLRTAAADPARQATDGVFVEWDRSGAVVDAGSFDELKYRMQPLQVTVAPELLGATVTLTYAAGSAPGTELYLADAPHARLTVPQTWSAADFQAHTLTRNVLVRGAAPGDAVLELRYRQGSSTIAEGKVRLRVAAFPGAVGVETAGVYPLFRGLRTVNRGDRIKTALDPSRHAERTGRKAAVYVVAHKTSAQWASDPTLVDVAGGPVETVIRAGSIADNLVTTGAVAAPGLYDVVYDFGNFADDPARFVRDGRLDPGDILDRGEREASLEVMGPMTDVGPDTPAPASLYGMTAPATTLLPAGYDGLMSDFDFRLRGQVVYPAALSGPAPLVVFAHGNHVPYTVLMGGVPTPVSPVLTTDENFKGHGYLQEQLASRGFVTVSVDLDETYGGPPAGPSIAGFGIQLRAWILLKNVEALLTDGTIAGGALTGKIDASRIYLVGHSRGGEAALAAYDLLKNPAHRPPGASLTGLLDWNGVKAVVTLAPTTALVTSSAYPIAAPAVPYLLLYGSADGDVVGAALPPAALVPAALEPFRHYDRASGDKFAVRIEGGNHSNFNDSWPYDDAREELSASSDLLTAVVRTYASPVGAPATLVNRDSQRKFAIGYLNAFFAMVSGQDGGARDDFLEPPSVLRPLGVGTTLALYGQARQNVSKTVLDDYETNPSRTLSASGQSVSFTLPSGDVSEIPLQDSDLVSEADAANRFFQETQGVRLAWSAPAEYAQVLPSAEQDLRGARVVSFRAAQQPKTGPGPLSFAVELEDGAGGTSAVSLSAFGRLEPVYTARWPGGVIETTSAAFKTFRIPIAAFVAGGRSLDLGHIVKIRFKLGGPGESPSGHVALDDLEIER